MNNLKTWPEVAYVGLNGFESKVPKYVYCPKEGFCIYSYPCSDSVTYIRADIAKKREKALLSAVYDMHYTRNCSEEDFFIMVYAEANVEELRNGRI